MDPNTNLTCQLRKARSIITEYQMRGEPSEMLGAYELAQLVVAMNDWICKGGFLPDKWVLFNVHCKPATGNVNPVV